jgi:hypothetical protein
VLTSAEQITAFTVSGDYESAYRVGREALSGGVQDTAVLSALYALTAKLRSECMDMAVRKADVGDGYFSKENLLRAVNALTGEDMYGRIL